MGIIEIPSGLITLQRTTNETKCVTNKLLKHFVRPGSTIVTDEGGSFFDIELLENEEGESLEYKHRTVCHSGQYNSGGNWSYFKDYDSNTHNNSIEGQLFDGVFHGFMFMKFWTFRSNEKYIPHDE